MQMMSKHALAGCALAVGLAVAVGAARTAPAQMIADALEAGRRQGKPVLVVVLSSKAADSRRFEGETLGESAVRDRLSHFVLVRLDLEAHAPDVRDLEQRTGKVIDAAPLTAALDLQGRLVADTRGFVPPAEFIAVLDEALERVREP